MKRTKTLTLDESYLNLLLSVLNQHTSHIMRDEENTLSESIVLEKIDHLISFIKSAPWNEGGYV